MNDVILPISPLCLRFFLGVGGEAAEIASRTFGRLRMSDADIVGTDCEMFIFGAILNEEH